MNNMLKEVLKGNNIPEILKSIISKLYENGPINRSDVEILSLIKYFFPEIFKDYEQEILAIMGLFYKKPFANSIESLLMLEFGESIKEKYGENFTPVQMDIINNVINNKTFCFSSSTSTGKSFVFRELLKNSTGDIIIIVPSRALINEYFIKVRAIFLDEKVNILPFVDFINTKKCKKNIFILTPERAKEVFKFKERINLELVLFDEAQLTNEDSERGVIFDAIVRRFKKNFPSTKMLFAFPFVNNPESQIIKNKLNDELNNYMVYDEKNVGQIFFSKDESNFYLFGIEKEIMGSNREKVDFDPIKRILNSNGSILIYTSKSKIIDQRILDEYRDYCSLCDEITDPKALDLISKFNSYMGTNDDKTKYGYSVMSKLLKRGIILHHGSLPLQARILIEELTRMGFCKICFSTSTLVQGINMPFDMVVLDRLESKELEMKNLIGRAGRSTINPVFDYGIIVVKDSRKTLLRDILCKKSTINAESILDTNKELPEDISNYRDALNNDSFDDEYNLTKKDVEKLSEEYIFSVAEKILELCFKNDYIISGDDFFELSKENRNQIYSYFHQIYSYYIGSRELSQGEKSVIDTSIRILLWQIQGKTFKQIVGYRYSYIRKHNEVRKLLTKYKNVENRDESFFKELESIKAKATMKNSNIPNKDLPFIPLFNFETPAYNVSYDIVAFDTYDYIDKTIGFKLKDIYYALFYQLYLKKENINAMKMANYIKYGTIDEKEIMLLRYGFDFETIDWLKEKVESITEEEMVLKNVEFSEEEYETIKMYL